MTKSSLNYKTVREFSAIDQFRQAMQAARIHIGEIIADGKLHRAHNEGDKQGTKNIAYTLHLDGCPAGWFMDFKSGISETWRSGKRFQNFL